MAAEIATLPTSSSPVSPAAAKAENAGAPASQTALDPADLDAGSVKTTPRRLDPQDDADFLLDPAEVDMGRRAAENYLSTFRNDDGRRLAEEALETLATVISGGKCDSVEFPWQQVRPYHGAAALTILKEKGAPARIEALRCRRDTTRNYRVVPEAYPTRQVQKIRSTLDKVIKQCSELGFVPAEPEAPAKARSGGKSAPKKKAAAAQRLLGDGELRALVAASAAAGHEAGARDAVLFSLVYRGLKIAEITSLTLDSVKFSSKTGVCSIVARTAKSGGRGRRIELTNAELIYLEDWLELRGDGQGPLLCTIVRPGKIEGKRLTIAALKTTCEERAQQARVEEFTPNDLSRSADALTQHRKATRRKATRKAQEELSEAERLIFDAAHEIDPDDEGEMIRFPFLGLDI